MSSALVAFTMLVDSTAGCQMDSFQSETGVTKSEAAQFHGVESQLYMS